MPFIGAAIAGAIGLVGTAATIGGALINTGIAVGLSYLSASLQKQSAQSAGGVQTSIQLGGDVPRGCIYGRQGVAGQLLYWNTSIGDNNYLQMIYALGEGIHEDLEAIWVGGTKRTLTLESQDAYHKTYVVGGFQASNGLPLLRVEFWFGRSDQPAAPDLIQWASPVGRWTASDRLAGVCYVNVRAFYFDKAFDSGIPDVRFGVKGRRLYDWRKDGTNGGDGAHRWNDPLTWEFSENPILQLYDFQRGVRLGSEVVIGMGVPPADLIMDMYTSAANACDEWINEMSGAVRRYVCGTYVSAAEEYGSVIARILDSCAGSLYERVGAYGPLAGVPQAIVYPTINDGDLVSGRPVTFSAKLGRTDLVNGVFGSSASPDDMWEQVPYPAHVDAAAEAEDTEQRRVSVDFPQVPRQAQAQRLALITLRLARLQATATITLGMAAIVLEPGDWLRWDSARYGDKRWIITALTQNDDQTVTLQLRQISVTAYGWDAGNELEPSEVGAPGVPGFRLNTVTGFSLAAITMTGAGGMKQPGIRIFWTPVTDPTVTGIIVEYRISGTTDVMTARIDTVNNGEFLITGGLQSETEYDVRAILTTDPARDVSWTAWDVITTTELLVPATVADGTITPAKFVEGLRAMVMVQQAEAVEGLQEEWARIARIVAEVDAAQDINRRDLTRSLSITVGAASARFTEQITVMAGDVQAVAQQVVDLEADFGEASSQIGQQLTTLASETEAIASQVTDLSAQVGGFEAGLSIRGVAAASNPGGAFAAWDLAAKAGSGGTFALSGLSIGVWEDGGGGYTGAVYVRGDQFAVLTGDGLKSVFAVNSTTGQVFVSGDMYAAGSITGTHLATATIETINLKSQSVTTSVLTLGGVTTDRISLGAVTGAASSFVGSISGNQQASTNLTNTSINKDENGFSQISIAFRFVNNLNNGIWMARTVSIYRNGNKIRDFIMSTLSGVNNELFRSFIDNSSFSGVANYSAVIDLALASDVYTNVEIIAVGYKR